MKRREFLAATAVMVSATAIPLVAEAKRQTIVELSGFGLSPVKREGSVLAQGGGKLYKISGIDQLGNTITEYVRDGQATENFYTVVDGVEEVKQ